MANLPDYILENRAHWDAQAEGYVAAAERAWARDEPTWGIWSVPEAEIKIFPDRLNGVDAIELGCGTAYVSSWMARRGARVVGIDNSENQLATARRMQREHALDFRLIHGIAEKVEMPDASFDFAISEYGACLWADPKKWIPECARLLRRGGRLHFLTNSHLMALCTPDYNGVAATNRLLRPARGMHELRWPDDPGVEFHLSHADWIRLFKESGLEVEDLIDVYPSEGASTRYEFVTVDWARKWPSEEIWKVRKR